MALDSVLLLHHAAGAASDWDEIVPRLSGRVPAFAFDLPGHGACPGPALRSVEEMASFAAGVARERGERFVLVGHSMGGAVALGMALEFPALVAGLVLVSTGARLRVAATLLDLVREHFQDFGQQMVAMGLSPSADPSVLARWVMRPWPVSPAAAFADFAACGAFDVRGRLGEIAVPTTILAGEDDLMIPAKRAKELSDGIAGSRLRVLPATGHLAIWERPDAVVEETLALVDRVSGVPR